MSATTTVLPGLPASPGRTSGPALRLPDPVLEPPAGVRVPPSGDVAAAAARIADSSHRVRAALEADAARVEGDAREILQATAAIAADPALLDDARRRVLEEHLVPERAVWEAAAEVAAMFEALGGVFAERSHDVVDVRNRIVADLTGRPAPGLPACDHAYVLVAGDLAPALAATLDRARVRAIVTATGGPTSHTAIIARSLGVPAVVSVDGLVAAVHDGDVLVVDGDAGTVTVRPEAGDEPADLAPAGAPVFAGRGLTADGVHVPLLANVGTPAEALAAAAAGAEGIGLYRTESSFLGRTLAPSVEEQVATYRAVLEAFAGRTVVVRTLDAGAQQRLPFLVDHGEDNPALGVRGLRTSAAHPDLLEDQLRAVARAADGSGADVWVMAPMVATVEESDRFVALCAAQGLTTAGVMVEVPSAALVAGPILERAAFASVGTNDLTQYTMAADRSLGTVATLHDPWQPAVLQLVALTCAAGTARGRPVGVSGEAAVDPALACVLVGLGAAHLSVRPNALGPVAAGLARATLEQCRAAAAAALAAPTAERARLAALAALPPAETDVVAA
ncbi:phosphoenolpyruvate--protein phosphotransferase [Cellulomonas marina]|uniref:Phosphoenolpyruvate-protein phosphotransferase n=1 Tax=Cellulomonas marina TaxID=988821 RepID=A0A1I0V8L9_9CELL|nr:phosphoenolpyruvate--protein phosphotransferase [Cellulomonas marina]GIG29215.1 phosphoenolpyruvate-protein phosphotransferase [Cellulomonas marina]SFA72709.1 phosphotransferase system, enzyme I, PtsI [Cellulomonas marina]